MKKAFTMIEIIFVIVILGILSFIVIPQFLSARNDAYLVKQASNVKILINDIGVYYARNGKFITNKYGVLDLSAMSNVKGDKNSNNYWYVFTASDGKECFDISFVNDKGRVKFQTLYSPRQKPSNACLSLVEFLKQSGIDITSDVGIENINKMI